MFIGLFGLFTTLADWFKIIIKRNYIYQYVQINIYSILAPIISFYIKFNLHVYYSFNNNLIFIWFNFRFIINTYKFLV